MKFIKWVMEVRPLRLLVDCMAACACIMVSHFGSPQPLSSTLQGDHLRTQPKHPHPQALGASVLYAAFEAAGYFGVSKDYGNLTQLRSCLVRHFVVVDDCRNRRKIQTGTGKVKGSARVDLRSLM